MDTRISCSRVHVPLAVVLPHVLRQEAHHALDLPKPLSIAAVSIVRVRPPTCANEGFELSADTRLDSTASRSVGRRRTGRGGEGALGGVDTAGPLRQRRKETGFV